MTAYLSSPVVVTLTTAVFLMFSSVIAASRFVAAHASIVERRKSRLSPR